MNSTQYTVDRRDIRFVQKEFLKVQELIRLPDFKGFTEEDFDLIVQEGNNFAEEVLAPLNKGGDERPARLENGGVVTPPGFKEAWRKLSEAGWLGINSPVDFGGQGLPISVAVGVLEGFFGANPAMYLTPMLTTGSAGLIVAFGNERQKADYCEKMITGRWGGSMCLSEPDAGSAVGDITTSAIKAPGGDHYLIKGTKVWISGGDHDFTDNIVHLVLARVKGAPAGPKGISLFIVPKFRLNAQGEPGEFNDVSTIRLEHKLGIKGSPTAMLEFGGKDDCHGYLLEGENLGMGQMFRLMNEARYVVAYQGLGAAAGAYRNTLAYARERVQGIPIEKGKDRSAVRKAIVHHPDIRNALMTMKAVVEGTRGLIYALGLYTDLAKHGPEDTRSHYHDLVDILTPVAKNAGADQGFEAIRLGIQVLGGVGFTEEFPLAQHLRDTKIASIYEGTTGIQALDLVTRKLTLRGGALFQTLLKEVGGLKPGLAKAESLNQALHEWKDALELLKRTVGSLANVAEELGPREGVFNATDVTTFFGDVMSSYYLLQMALLAEARMEALAKGKGDIRALAEENEEVAFYFNKVKTAEHYAFQILPRVKSIAAKVQSRNFAALEAVL
ncbi:MAG: acyl-CoA dehydrogenase [Deltaproteobacteria bacterium]|nr:acyl-CoA dehydrogenase [Deltaproteobacteria bacterium]